MRRSSLFLALGALSAAGCSPADPAAREQTGAAVLADESLTAPSQPNAIRYLEQSTFGPTLNPTYPADNPAHIVSVGIIQAITDELAQPATPYDTVDDLGAQFYFHAVTGHDQLRQRVAFALSQIMVVSLNKFGALSDNGIAAVGTYLNTLGAGAFGNYRALMEAVTKTAAMGRYLDMLNNDVYTTGSVTTSPNENYARELMQLFTLGLDLINEDGSLMLDGNGNAQPTYQQDDVENLSHVLTGWTYGAANNACPKAAGKSNPANWTAPMQACPLNHDVAWPTPFALPTASATKQTTLGAPAQQNLTEALDIIFGHANLPPFISKQLIQQLVTSNPSPAYVTRIVQVFKDDGTHTRGNLAAVVRAILQDPEARGPVPPFALQPTYGHLRSPALFMTNVLRWSNGAMVLGTGETTVPVVAGKKLNSLGTLDGQDVFTPPTVFSYYPPAAALPGSATLVGPEFAINNAASQFARSNFLNGLLFASSVTNVTTDLSGIPGDTSGMLQWLTTYMLHGSMSPQLTSIVSAAITDPSIQSQPVATLKSLAIYLVATSPEFQVQR